MSIGQALNSSPYDEGQTSYDTYLSICNIAVGNGKYGTAARALAGKLRETQLQHNRWVTSLPGLVLDFCPTCFDIQKFPHFYVHNEFPSPTSLMSWHL